MKVIEDSAYIKIDGINLRDIYQKNAGSILKFFRSILPDYINKRKSWINNLKVGDIVVYESGYSHQTVFIKTTIVDILPKRRFKTIDMDQYARERTWDSLGLEMSGYFMLEPNSDIFNHVNQLAFLSNA